MTKTKQPKLSKLGYPDWVPVLKADDFCRGAYTSIGRHCVVGWINAIFPSNSHTNPHMNIPECSRTPANKKARYILSRILRDRTLIFIGVSLESFSDNFSEGLSHRGTRVSIFNQMLSKLGYDIENAE